MLHQHHWVRWDQGNCALVTKVSHPHSCFAEAVGEHMQQHACSITPGVLSDCIGIAGLESIPRPGSSNSCMYGGLHYVTAKR